MIPNIDPLTGYCERNSPGREFGIFIYLNQMAEVLPSAELRNGSTYRRKSTRSRRRTPGAGEKVHVSPVFLLPVGAYHY